MAPEPRIPQPEGLNAEFYARAHEGVLHLQQCADCATFRHPPRYRCASCGSADHRWTPSPGRGVLYSWTVTHLSVDPGWAGEIPYATGVIELDEGPRLIGAMEGIAHADLALGLPLQLRLTPHSAEFVFLTLVPASTGSPGTPMASSSGS